LESFIAGSYHAPEGPFAPVLVMVSDCPDKSLACDPMGAALALKVMGGPEATAMAIV
jgi:hypothetical protein